MEHASYQCTNENINAIIAGMEPKENDRILAIAGSGDQVFALLEYARSVIAVDNSHTQIEFVRRRADSLRRGDYRKFLEAKPPYFPVPDNDKTHRYLLSLRNKYFRGESLRRRSRLERIRRRLDGLEIIEGDIFQLVKGQKFNKLYMSNVNVDPDYGLGNLSEPLADGTIVYFTHNTELYLTLSSRTGRMVLDERMTSASRSPDPHLTWVQPTVYRKVAPPLEVSPIAPLRAPVAYAP